MHIDGEPWLQAPAQLTVRFFISFLERALRSWLAFEHFMKKKLPWHGHIHIHLNTYHAMDLWQKLGNKGEGCQKTSCG